VQGAVTETGPDASYALPTDVDFHAMTRQLAPQAPRPEPTTVLVRRGTAHGLRRQASALTEGVAGPDRTTSWDRLVLDASSVESVTDDVLSFGSDAYAESPPALRQSVIDRLTAATR
jgi:proteasome accessory factor B